jgi:hypothetical protein
VRLAEAPVVVRYHDADMTEAANVALRRDKQKSSDPFLGAWILVSFEHVLPSGEVSRPFGDSPTGLILYQADGRMSAQVSVANPKRFAGEEPVQASNEEAAAAWRTYFGYWGSFIVAAEKQAVVHRVEGSSFANWIGTEQVRHFRFDGANRLILQTQSPSGHSTAIWQRMFD